MQNKTPSGKQWLLPLCAAGIFFFLALFRLGTVPAPLYDELEIANWAILNMQGMRLFVQPLFGINSIGIPGQTCFYTGSLPLYVPVPFILALGPNIAALRIGFVIIAALGLWSFFVCIKSWLGRGPALLAMFLLATNPVFIAMARSGAESEELPTNALFLAGLALLTTFAKNGKKRHAALAGLAWGLALSVKILLLVYAFALIAALAAAGTRTRARLAERILGRGTAGPVLFCAAFCLGALPFINYALSANGADGGVMAGLTSSIHDIFFGPGRELSPAVRVQARLLHLAHFFRDNFLQAANRQNVPSAAAGELWNPLFAPLALAACGLYLFDRKLFPAAMKALVRAGTVFYALVFAALCMTPTDPLLNHMSAMLPAIQLSQALFAWLALKANSGTLRKAMLVALAFACLHCAGANAVSLRAFFRLNRIDAQNARACTAILENASRQRLHPFAVTGAAYVPMNTALWSLPKNARHEFPHPGLVRQCTESVCRMDIEAPHPANGTLYVAIADEKDRKRLEQCPGLEYKRLFGQDTEESGKTFSLYCTRPRKSQGITRLFRLLNLHYMPLPRPKAPQGSSIRHPLHAAPAADRSFSGK